MTPFLSIIIPAYNASRFIGNCINSIVCQDFENYEIIIVNDGSTDDTLQICNSFHKENERIKIFNQPNHGVSYSRNVGLSNAEGEYIWFVDADDKLSHFSIREMAENIKSLSCPDIVRGEYQAIDERDCNLFKSKPRLHTKAELITVTPEVFFSKCVRQDFFLWLLWIKRDIIADMHFPTGRIYMEDADFICNFIAKIKTAAYTSSIIYRYRKYPEAASSSLTSEKVLDIHSLLENICTIATGERCLWIIKYLREVSNRALLTIVDFLNDLPTERRKKMMNVFCTQLLMNELAETFGTNKSEWGLFEREGEISYFRKYNIRKYRRHLGNKVRSLLYKIFE